MEITRVPKIYANQVQPKNNAVDVTEQVSQEAAAPKQSLFRTAEDRGLNWNDDALTQYGFTPQEIERLKSKGLADGTIDYFLKQGWITGGETPGEQEAPEVPEEQEVPQPQYEQPEQEAPPVQATQGNSLGDFVSNVEDFRSRDNVYTSGDGSQSADPVASVLAANGISEDSPSYNWYYGREYNRQKTGYASPGLLGGQGFFS